MAERNVDDDNDISMEERLAWLRERGVLVETPEERRAKELKKSTKDNDNDDDVVKEKISFVFLPHDTSKAMEELTFDCSTRDSSGDELLEYLKPMFTALSSGKEVDLELYRRNATAQTLTGGDTTTSVSPETLHQVAEEGNVEKFTLVHPTASNKYVGVYIYLDEVGMLRRLPLNTRATDFARRAGYDPAPQFYGNVFLGRVQAKRGVVAVLNNRSFQLGPDTSSNAPWIQQAPMDNIARQMELNQMTGRAETQAAVVGTDGTEKKEEGGYTWTQTEEEIEIVLPITATTTSKDVTTKFLPKSILIKIKKECVLAFTLFERIDPDGCTWTIDRNDTSVDLVLTLEKSEQALWPRIED